MRRRLATIAVVAVLLLSGCAQGYDSAEERARASAEELAESLRDVAPESIGVGATGSLEGVWVSARLDQTSFAETRDFLEDALPVVEDSPLGSLPIHVSLVYEGGASREGMPSGSATLDWRGYDPARAERYFGAVQLWLNVLADPGVQFNEVFDVQAAYVYGSISVFDDRDLETYRAELVDALEKAGYTDPLIVVAAAPVPAS
ncbi:hypothetical protein [Agreia sp. Leaf210]|uniref:hypothetical protein n=1 Tax=Agreia sp. Leaf210 TaxID=1735682 RepID=UPI0006FCC86B|nr:hypothetical protein [Agreia sp. Leaf210]KQM57530.1 hypothetical protein ASE64_15335 [Agreia sp. Leaf210]